MADLESTNISETPHGANNTSVRGSHDSYEASDSGYLTLTPRSGNFTPNISGSRSSRGSFTSVKRHYRLRSDPRKSSQRPRSKFNHLINSSDSLIDESPELSSAGISQDSANFSCEHQISSIDESSSFEGRSSILPDSRHIVAELRERRTRNRRAWRSTAAPATPASRVELLSPPPSPAVPSSSFVASEPIEDDVEMKLVIGPQSTPYSETSPRTNKSGTEVNFSHTLDNYSNGKAIFSLNFSPTTRKISTLTTVNSMDNKKLSKLVINDHVNLSEIRPKRLDFSQRALTYARHRTRATPDFTGKVHVDLLTFLGEKSNHWRVVSKILAHLSPQDLCSVSMVSKPWRRICANDSRANIRRLSHIILRQNAKENLKLIKKAKIEGTIQMSPKSRFARKGYLMEVQNFLQVPRIPLSPNSPPVSPSKIKFHSFVKASRTLEPWEHLLPCPNCTFPCHVDDEKNVGKCSRRGCSMEFCTSCSSRPHSGPCKTPLLATPTKRNKRLIVGSRQSKRNLRRL